MIAIPAIIANKIPFLGVEALPDDNFPYAFPQIKIAIMMTNTPLHSKN